MPGVIIIDEIIRGLVRKDPTIKVDNFPVVKFLLPLNPDIVVQAKVQEMKTGLLQVTLFQNELMIVSGQFRFAQDGDS